MTHRNNTFDSRVKEGPSSRRVFDLVRHQGRLDVFHGVRSLNHQEPVLLILKGNRIAVEDPADQRVAQKEGFSYRMNPPVCCFPSLQDVSPVLGWPKQSNPRGTFGGQSPSRGMEAAQSPSRRLYRLSHSFLIMIFVWTSGRRAELLRELQITICNLGARGFAGFCRSWHINP